MDSEYSAYRTYLELADWRRQVAGLYADVRARALSDPADALLHWRTVREQLYRAHPQSPIPVERRAAFEALHFPYDPALRFDLPVVPDVPAVPDAPARAAGAEGERTIPTSGGGDMLFRRIGWVDVPFPAGTRRLALSWMTGYGDGLFLSFRDATGGVQTYGGGRYLLDGAKSADLGGDAARGTIVLDFNFAYQPSCAFDPRWNCPLTPPENRLDLPIHAGERLS